KEFQHLCGRQVLSRGKEISSDDILHGEKMVAGLQHLLEVVDLSDMRMAKLGHRLKFGFEPADPLALQRVRLDHLERDIALGIERIEDAVDNPHAPFSENLLDLIPTVDLKSERQGCNRLAERDGVRLVEIGHPIFVPTPPVSDDR